MAIATLSFWFIRIDTLRWVVMSLEQDFTRYPISIYRRGVRIVLAFVLPFAFMNYFPATYFLQKAETGLHLNPAVGLLTPASGSHGWAPRTRFGSLACATIREPAPEAGCIPELRRRRSWSA